jgi:methylthioribose-1-phosphate isomerase
VTAGAPLRWNGDALTILDQTRLPGERVELRCTEPEQVADAIRRLAVRGAPAIGLAAAYGAVLGLRGVPPERARERFDAVAELLGSTRPTAVNLGWALARAREALERAAGGDPAEALLELAHTLARDQERADRAMAAAGAALFEAGDRALTHCNTGPLATGGYGTALGVLRAARDAGCLEHVWVDETRPLLQGARLTAWELDNLGIPFRVVPDAAVGLLMGRGLVDRVVVGADRIAANGDVANKVGTYTVAICAQRHGIPLYVAAPLSTIDPATPTGAEIPIEERPGDEVTTLAGSRLAPAGAPAANWAFDVTPAELVAGIVTEAGVLEPPYDRSIARALGRL